MSEFTVDPALDLVLERELDVPPELVWEAWTRPEHLKEWFAPKPWSVAEVELDLRPGGAFRTVMRSPDGDLVDGGAGCVLEVVEHRRLVFTEALGAGFRPVAADLPFTAVITIEPTASGSRYRALAVHGTAETRDRHAAMGFSEGWGAALDQLVELVGRL